jgi:hypothetical protein
MTQFDFMACDRQGVPSQWQKSVCPGGYSIQVTTILHQALKINNKTKK